MRFNLIFANPPYSIKANGNRDAFGNDKYGRNFLGTPPQGRADYAFWQHILKSMDKKTGRCAILFPHGVLFRKEEKDMRAKLINADLLECVIGLGPNLFYNSNMEACIVICKSRKEASRAGKILFINAKNEYTHKSTQTYLEQKHIDKISKAYNEFADVNEFARVVTLPEIRNNDSSLNISLYVNIDNKTEVKSYRKLDECIADFRSNSEDLDALVSDISQMLSGLEDED